MEEPGHILLTGATDLPGRAWLENGALLPANICQGRLINALQFLTTNPERRTPLVSWNRLVPWQLSRA
jgi:hypothetical protein